MQNCGQFWIQRYLLLRFAPYWLRDGWLKTKYRKGLGGSLFQLSSFFCVEWDFEGQKTRGTTFVFRRLFGSKRILAFFSGLRSIRYEIAKRNSLEEVNGRTLFRAAIVRSRPEKNCSFFPQFWRKVVGLFFCPKKRPPTTIASKCECSVKWPLRRLVPETLMNISWKSLSVCVRIRLLLGFYPFLFMLLFL